MQVHYGLCQHLLQHSNAADEAVVQLVKIATENYDFKFCKHIPGPPSFGVSDYSPLQRDLGCS